MKRELHIAEKTVCKLDTHLLQNINVSRIIQISNSTIQEFDQCVHQSGRTRRST